MCACKSIDCKDMEIKAASDVVSVTWKIKHALCCCVDRCLYSPPFEFSETMWCLAFFPFHESDSGTFLNVDLGGDDDDEANIDLNLCIFFQLGLRDSSGQLQHTFEGRKRFEFGDRYGPKDGLIQLDELETKRKELMPGNILTVFCELRNGYSVSWKPATTDCRTSIHIDMLVSDMDLMLKEQKNCDVTLHLGKDEFHAHKNILGARSSVFAAMFEHDLLENHSNTVIIQDIHPSDFSVVLDYIYTGKIPELSIEQAIGVYVAADKYDLKGLKFHYRDILLDKLSTDWFFEIAVLADSHNDGKLMDGVKLFARGNVQSLLKSDKCDNFFQNYLRIALEILRSASSGFSTKA